MSSQYNVAVTWKVKPGCEEAFEKSMLAVFADVLGKTGTLGSVLVRPTPGSRSQEYGILGSYESKEAYANFCKSDTFLKWQEDVKPMVEGDYSREELHGLEAFFSNPGLQKQPPKWKMSLVTWIGVWPTVFVVMGSLAPHMKQIPDFFSKGIATFIVVQILTWIAMPLLTRILKPWIMK